MNIMRFVLPMQNIIDYPPDDPDDDAWYGVYVAGISGSVESIYRMRTIVKWEEPPTAAQVEVFRDMVSMFLGRELSISIKEN